MRWQLQAPAPVPIPEPENAHACVSVACDIIRLLHKLHYRKLHYLMREHRVCARDGMGEGIYLQLQHENDTLTTFWLYIDCFAYTITLPLPLCLPFLSFPRLSGDCLLESYAIRCTHIARRTSHVANIRYCTPAFGWRVLQTQFRLAFGSLQMTIFIMHTRRAWAHTVSISPPDLCFDVYRKFS